jgi:hypothetical protein
MGCPFKTTGRTIATKTNRTKRTSNRLFIGPPAYSKAAAYLETNKTPEGSLDTQSSGGKSTSLFGTA